MGCDIHAVIEVKRPGDKWRLCKELDGYSLLRDYQFFGALVQDHARTRDVMGRFPARGVPPDFSGDVESLLGDHTYSWLTPEEWGQCVEDYEREDPSPAKQWREVLRYFEDGWGLRNSAADKFRIVFGFDS